MHRSVFARLRTDEATDLFDLRFVEPQDVALLGAETIAPAKQDSPIPGGTMEGEEAAAPVRIEGTGVAGIAPRRIQHQAIQVATCGDQVERCMDRLLCGRGQRPRDSQAQLEE